MAVQSNQNMLSSCFDPFNHGPRFSPSGGVHRMKWKTGPQQCGRRNDRAWLTPTRVRFDEGSNIMYDSPHRDVDECRSVWFSAEDYKSFKACFVESVKSIRKSKDLRAQCRLIEETFDTMCHPVVCGNTDDPRTTTSTEQDVRTSGHVKNLKQVYRGNEELVGLERYAAKKVLQYKSSRRSQIIDSVLDAQDHLLLFNFMDNSSSVLPYRADQVKETILREFCERLSEPSRRFATYVALAQASH